MPLIWATSPGAPSLQRRPRPSLPPGFRPQHGRSEIEQSGGAQLVEPRQVVQTIETKMDQKFLSRHPQQWAPGPGTPALGPYPAGLHQCIDRASGNGNTTDLLDLGAG